jgi:hypothetical protein
VAEEEEESMEVAKELIKLVKVLKLSRGHSMD